MIFFHTVEIPFLKCKQTNSIVQYFVFGSALLVLFKTGGKVFFVKSQQQTLLPDNL